MPKAFQSEKILMDPERIPSRSRAGVRKARGSGAGSIESKAFVRRIVKKGKKEKERKRKERTEPLPFPQKKFQTSSFRPFFRKFSSAPSVSSREYQHILILKKEGDSGPVDLVFTSLDFIKFLRLGG